MAWVTKLLEKIGVDKKDIKPFALFIAGVMVTLVVLVATPFFATIAPTLLIVAFGALFVVLWFMAGYAVFRSLLVASVGLSFIIFIGQSYCALPIDQHVANDSLSTLIGFGLIYVVAQLGRSLYRELFGDKEAKEGMVNLFKDANRNKHPWMILVIYGLLISLFLWQISRVIMPIIHAVSTCSV
jgi:hypothetical protein